VVLELFEQLVEDTLLEAHGDELALAVGVHQAERGRGHAGDRGSDSDHGLELGVRRHVEHAVTVPVCHAGSLPPRHGPVALAHGPPVVDVVPCLSAGEGPH